MPNLINCFISAPFTTQEVEGDSVSNNQLENQVYEGATLNEGQYKFLITPEPFYVVDTTDFTINNVAGLAAGNNNTILWSDAITGGGNGSFTSTDIAGITLSNTGTGGELLNTILVTVTLKPTFVMPSADKTILLNIAGTAPAYVPNVIVEDPILFNSENIFVSLSMMNNDPLVKIAPPRTNRMTMLFENNSSTYDDLAANAFWPNYPALLGQVPGNTYPAVLEYGSNGSIILDEIWPNCGSDILNCNAIYEAGYGYNTYVVSGAKRPTGVELGGSGLQYFGVQESQQFGGWTRAYTNGNIGVDDATPELIYSEIVPPRCGGSYQFNIGSENYNVVGSTLGQACGVSISSGMNWHIRSTTNQSNYDPAAGGIGAFSQFIDVYSSVTSYRDINNNLVHIPWTSSNNLSAVDLDNIVLTQLDCWTVNVFIPWNQNFVIPPSGVLPIHECTNSSIMVKNLFTCFVGNTPSESYGCTYPTGQMENDVYPAGTFNFNSEGNTSDTNTLPNGDTPAPGITHPSC
tara:strand:- start:7633 stop:9186 length:1554 start_codon:yes stop_codon:yes gene_type:complete